ncbi:hypothetical protein N9L47_13695, partial [Rhodobacteraceae bacterium]|nr:hypothetical protein [Paracoccaceae bacterium]
SRSNDRIKFSQLDDSEIPNYPIDNYFNSRSRPKLKTDATAVERWRALLRNKWNSPPWRGGPSSFWKVFDTGEIDSEGDKVFEISDTLAV